MDNTRKGHRRIVLIGGNTASLWTMKKFSTPVAHGRRSKVLRQVAAYYDQENPQSIKLAFVPSLFNPADYPSRPPYDNNLHIVQSLVVYMRKNPQLIAWDADHWPTHKKEIVQALRACHVHL